MVKTERELPEKSDIDRLLKLAQQPPDDELLRRFFQASKARAEEHGFDENEYRWLSVNLNSNPLWQEKWRELEQEAGIQVDWNTLSPPKVRQPEQENHFRWRFDIPRLVPAFRFAAGLALVLLISYGGLRVVSELRTPATYELASLDDYRADFSDLRRAAGLVGESDFESALQLLFNAKRDWLGLWPRYDAARVNSAIALLRAEFDKTDEPFMRAEIAFLLGKAYLMTNHIEEARTWLEAVLDQNVADYRREAQHLLGQLPTAPSD